MTNELRPSVVQMLEIGSDCGLTHLSQAYNNYMNHYDCFFLIEKYNEQHEDFLSNMLTLGLLESDDQGTLSFKDLTINEAMELIITGND